jgi:hypothetical protein
MMQEGGSRCVEVPQGVERLQGRRENEAGQGEREQERDGGEEEEEEREKWKERSWEFAAGICPADVEGESYGNNTMDVMFVHGYHRP